jgi:hypothetical protein
MYVSSTLNSVYSTHNLSYSTQYSTGKRVATTGDKSPDAAWIILFSLESSEVELTTKYAHFCQQKLRNVLCNRIFPFTVSTELCAQDISFAVLFFFELLRNEVNLLLNTSTSEKNLFLNSFVSPKCTQTLEAQVNNSREFG